MMKTKPDLYIDEVRLLKEQLSEAQGTAERLESQMLSETGVTPTIYAQRDPRWASHRLGSSSYTLGSSGCLVSSVASILADASSNREWTPAALNAWLTINHGYTDGNFIFSSINPLGIVKFDNVVDYAMPAPVEQIDKYDGFVIVKVDFNPVTMQVEQHYCRYLGQGKVMDPWHGDIADVVPRYRGKTAAEAIWRAVYYKRVEK